MKEKKSCKSRRKYEQHWSFHRSVWRTDRAQKRKHFL